ncbi:MAG: Rieske 2Fe-2S domain-containing protein [Aquincola sp.]|nr:Rieske 2Fe-2S domain-containing protein [Aquincola sp.]
MIIIGGGALFAKARIENAATELGAKRLEAMMAHGYKIVQWTPFKQSYDLGLLLGLGVFIGAYVGVGLALPSSSESVSPIQLTLRALVHAPFALLTVILAVGPLARLSPRFLPLLYNRRHLGVACFLLALAHGALVLLWYHGFGSLNPLTSLLVSNPRYDSIQGFPFESLGLAALIILFVMAATSHDFWNNVLGPNVWKALHMLVYWAYALIVAHIVLGSVQGEKSPLYAVVVGAGAALVALLHIVTGAREAKRDKGAQDLEADGWLRAGSAIDIPDGRAQIVTPPRGERIAVFRDGVHIYALSNVCRHQGGPLGEGRIVDGCVTCPWHGYQYDPATGVSPPPMLRNGLQSHADARPVPAASAGRRRSGGARGSARAPAARRTGRQHDEADAGRARHYRGADQTYRGYRSSWCRHLGSSSARPIRRRAGRATV